MVQPCSENTWKIIEFLRKSLGFLYAPCAKYMKFHKNTWCHHVPRIPEKSLNFQRNRWVPPMSRVQYTLNFMKMHGAAMFREYVKNHWIPKEIVGFPLCPVRKIHEISWKCMAQPCSENIWKIIKFLRKSLGFLYAPYTRYMKFHENAWCHHVPRIPEKILNS